MDSAKRMIELEAESNWLKEENRSVVARNKALKKQYLDESEEKDELIFTLKGEIMTVKRTHRMLKDKYVKMRDRSEERDELIIKLEEEVKARKDKCVDLRDKFECGERKWSEAEEKFTHLELEKRNLGMDLEATVRGGDEVMEKLKASEAMKDEYKMVVLELIQRIEALQREKREMQAKAKEKSEEIERILKEKMAIESQESKCIEVVKMIEEICRHWHLQVEKRKLETNLEATSKVGDEGVVEKINADEALQRSLEDKYGTIKKNKHVDTAKMKIEEELQDWVLRLRLEEELMKCKGNGDLQSSAWKKTLKFQEFLQRIDVLEKEKGEIEAEVSKFERERCREKEKALNGRRMAMEAKEKNMSELVRIIKVLWKENITMKAKHANKEKSEEIKMKMKAYDSGTVFSPEVLDLTEADLIGKFATGVSMVTSLSLALSYPIIAAAPHMFINTYKNALAIAVETNYSFPQADKVKEYLADPSKFAMAADVPDEDEKEEPAEDSDDDMDFSLFD